MFRWNPMRIGPRKRTVAALAAASCLAGFLARGCCKSVYGQEAVATQKAPNSSTVVPMCDTWTHDDLVRAMEDLLLRVAALEKRLTQLEAALPGQQGTGSAGGKSQGDLGSAAASQKPSRQPEQSKPRQCVWDPVNRRWICPNK